jgi:predicted O-methyltransferase YrrM
MISAEIENYCNSHSSPESKLLLKIERESHLQTTKGHMISGHLLGQLYRELIQLMRPTHVLEIGTFTGYTSIWIADALPENGQLTTIEKNKETHWLANQFFEKYEHSTKINSILGDALLVLNQENMKEKIWDFVLIDAAKEDNCTFFDLLLPQMRKGGIIVVDNVLWKGKVAQEIHDKVTSSIHAFNSKIIQDNRVTTLLLPIRDGISIIRKL